MIWLFVLIGAVVVFAIAAVTVGREAIRLGHAPPPTIFDVDEAVAHVADDLSEDAQARLTYAEVRQLVLAELDHLSDKGIFALPGHEPEVAERLDGEDPPVVVADEESVAAALSRADRDGLDVSDDDVFLVMASLQDYLAQIGAIGPRAGSG